MNSGPLVSHKSFSREQLHGKQLAICKEGAPTRCTINAGPATGNQYVLALEFGLSLKPAAAGTAQSTFGQEPLDQATVDKIEAVVAGSPLQRMRFDFAILQDAISGALMQYDPPKESPSLVKKDPPLTIDTSVSFDRS